MNTKISVSDLTGKTKEQIIAIATDLIAAQTVAFAPIAAIEGKDEFTDEKDFLHPAVIAVPAKDVITQLRELPEYVAYSAACDEVDKANETGAKNLSDSPEYRAISAAHTAAAEFEVAFSDTFKKIGELSAKVEEINSRMKAKGANLKALKAERTPIEDEIETLTETLIYPADYELSEKELPTFTPAPYPALDFTINGIPANLITGLERKSAKVKTAPVTAASSTRNANAKTDYGALSKEEKRRFELMVISAIEGGLSFKDAMAKVGKEHPIILTAPTSTFPNVVYKVKWQGQKEDGKIEVPVTVANYKKLKG